MLVCAAVCAGVDSACVAAEQCTALCVACYCVLQATRAFKLAGLMDDQGRWSGGDTVCVQVSEWGEAWGGVLTQAIWPLTAGAAQCIDKECTQPRLLAVFLGQQADGCTCCD